MHMQPVFNSAKHGAGSKELKPAARVVGGKVAEDLFKRGLCLPSGTAMTEEDLDRVVSVILRCRKNKMVKKEERTYISRFKFQRDVRSYEIGLARQALKR
jgi:hypothetical protein